MNSLDTTNHLQRRLFTAGAAVPAIVDHLAKTYRNEQPK